MNFELQTTSYFDSEARKLVKRHRSFIDDLQEFRDSILANPYQGVEISPGIRKIRLAIDSKGRGKSGGARIITFTYLVNEKDGVVILLLLYDKADASSIKMNVVRKILKDLGLDAQLLQTEGRLKEPVLVSSCALSMATSSSRCGRNTTTRCPTTTRTCCRSSGFRSWGITNNRLTDYA